MATASVDQHPVAVVETHEEPHKTGLRRVRLVRNKHYKHDGLKSYGHALLKYNFAPTKEGPFYVGDRLRNPGVFGVGRFRVQLPSGDRATQQQHVLMKRGGTHQDIHHHFGFHKNREGANVDGEVQASDIQHDALYLCPVTIGTPGQTLMLDFDTGSADLWVWSTQLPETTLAHYGRMHTIYDPHKSTTYKDKAGYTWQIQYGDGSTAAGTVCNDEVTLGGLRIQGQAVEQAHHLSESFAVGTGDGLLGLAFGAINTVKPNPVRTPVEKMMKQEDIPANCQLFTAYLGSWKDVKEKDHGESFYTFGYIDQEAVRAAGLSSNKDIWYTPVDTDNGFWQFTSSSAMINGQKLNYPKLSSAIADTGTTLALVSDEVCEAIYRTIPGAEYDRNNQGYVFPSRLTAEQLPVVQFDVGGKHFTVHKEDLAFADAGHGRVYGGIQSRGDLPFDILGDTFLKGIYAIFDQGNKRFGAVPRTEQFENLATK